MRLIQKRALFCVLFGLVCFTGPGIHAQPGAFPGAAPGIPAGMPGNMPGLPGGIPGAMPGMPGMPGDMPGMPGGMPSMPRMGMPERIWSCQGCGKEVGRGLTTPSVANCPHCGVRFNNTIEGMMANSNDRMDDVLKRSRTSTPSYSSNSNSSAVAGRIVGLVILLVGALFVLAVVVGAVVLFVYVIKAATAPQKKVKKTRRRPSSGWEKDDD